MSSYYPDTIVAIATPQQNGAIGIVRMSGPRSIEALNLIFTRHNKGIDKNIPRHFYLGRLHSPAETLVDHAMAVCMPGPNSFTGEDVVEIHCHGNQIILKKIVRELLDLPQKLEIRAAEPGEFTKRAFLNGKMDLTQAEAVHEIITSTSDRALRASLSNLDGRLSNIILQVRTQLCEALALVEAGFEFSEEEDVRTYQPKDLQDRLQVVAARLRQLLSAYNTSRLYDSGIVVAIIGTPNVGKSSLLNALLVEDRSIVTEIPGTTRDVVEGSRMIDGLRFVFKDTAGLRHSLDPIEAEGVRRSVSAAEEAEIVLEVFDDPKFDSQLKMSFRDDQIHIKILNKIDLVTDNSGIPFDFFDCVVSAKTGKGVESIERALTKTINEHYSVQNDVLVNERQRSMLDQSLKNILNINELLASTQTNDEIIAEEIRLTLCFLDEIIGEVTSEDVLTEIFSCFCIGK